MGARKIKKLDTTVTSITSADIAPEVVPPTLPGDGIGIVVDKKALRAALTRITGVADRKSTMPILANASLRVDHGGLTMTATDLNVSVRVKVGCKVGRTGTASIPAKKLADAIKSLPDGELSLYGSSKHDITITAGSATVTLDGMPDRDTPKFPALGDTARWITLDSALVRDAFASTVHAICKDETRFHLNGVLFEIAGQTLRTVATDGHRLVKREIEALPATPGDGEQIKPCIVQRKGCAELGKLLDGKSTCDVAVDRGYFWIRQGDSTLVVKLIDAQFPPYEQVIPKDHKRLVVVDSEALRGALFRARANCSETRGAVLSLATGKLTVSAGRPGESESSEALDAEFSCDPIKVCVNPAYLLDTLDQLDGKIVIAIGELYKPRKGEGEPCVLDPILVRSVEDAAMRPISSASFLSVVMPMRM